MIDDVVRSAKVKLGLTASYNDDDYLLAVYAQDAIDLVNDIRHFTPTSETPFEPKYRGVVSDMVVESYQKQGSEGTVQSTINGVNRQFASSSYSPALLGRVTPIVRIR